MDLETYRQAAGLTYQELADRIGVASHSGAWRLARGEAWPHDPERIERIREVSGGAVTLEAMHKKRLDWWRAQRGAPETIAAE